MDALRLWILPVASAIAIFVLFYRPIPTKKSNEDCSLLPHDHFWIYSKRVVTPNGVISGGVEIKGGRILSVVEKEHGKISNNHVVDYGEAVIMPGLIDVHAHLDDPGRAEWEGFPTGTKAAAAGGITMLVDMPLNSDPSTTSVEALKLKVDAAKRNIYIDVGFWGGLVPENAFNLTSLEGLLEAGVLGLKSFMCPSGINDFPMTNVSHIKEALHVLSKYRRPLLVHAEIELDSSIREEFGNNLGDFRSYSTYLKTRPPSWEQAAIGELSKVAEDTKPGARSEGAHLHIVHLSDASISLDLIKEAKNDGRSISVETCPHYLAFSAEEIQNGDTRFKCAPPIRDAANKKLLWKALKDGYIDMLSSDHSPTIPELKLLDKGDFLRSWGGISSLQIQGAGKFLQSMARHRKSHIFILTENEPTDKVNKYATWNEDNSTVMSWIMINVETNIAASLYFYSTAKDMWDSLKVTYSSVKNVSRIFIAEQVIFKLQQVCSPCNMVIWPRIWYYFTAAILMVE